MRRLYVGRWVVDAVGPEPEVRKIAAGSWWSDDFRPHLSGGKRLGYNPANVRPRPYNGGTFLLRRQRPRPKR